jgi:dTDP-4-amino-4,6-dideoxygalactose transaminase
MNKPAQRNFTVPLFQPVIGQEELDAAREALEHGWLGLGSYVEAFERELERLVGAPDRHVVAVSTGHAALHLSLLLAGVGPGDEVITPSFNNAADFQAILATGATPVFCDVDDDSLCIDMAGAERVVSPRTKAIIVIDYGCRLCDFEGVARFAEAHGLRVVHDAAHSFGSKINGRAVGGSSDLAIFSFDPVKTITCIDGGAVVVRSEDEVRRLQAMRLLGMTQPAKTAYAEARAWSYDIVTLGFRYHLSNIHAAIGLAQLRKLDWIIESRRRICRYYNSRLGELPGVRVPHTDFNDISPLLYYVRLPAPLRDRLRADLAERGIDSGIHWQPGHSFKLLKPFQRIALPVTDNVAREILTLPLSPSMTTDTAAIVCDAIEAFCRRAG